MRSSRKSRLINASTSNWRRLSFGNRSVPPATNMARGPRSAAICAASRAVSGVRYLNRGRRSKIQLLGCRLDFDAGRVWDRREARRSEPWRLSFVFASERLDDLLRCHGYLVEPNAERVEDRGADCRDDRKEWALPGFLGAIWSLGIDGLDDERLDLWHVEECWRLVLEHRRPFVQAFPERLLFHQCLAQTHVDAALHLALDQQRVDGAAHVVRNPYLVQMHEAGARVRVQVDDAGRIAVCRARADPRALVRSGDLWWRVAPGARERPEACLGQDACVLEAEVADSPGRHRHRIGRAAHLRRHGFD